MKRYLLAPAIICVMIFPVYSSTSRQVWWNNRIVSLQKDHAAMDSISGPDQAMLGYIDQEIASSRSVLSAMEGTKSGEGTAFESHAENIAGAITSLVFLEEATGERGGKEFKEKCDIELRQALARMIKEHLGAESKTLCERILDRDISALEKKTITLEMYLASASPLYQERKTAAVTIARQAVSSALKEGGVTGYEVSSRVADAVLKYLSDTGTGSSGGPCQGSLEKSWTWKRISSLLDAHFRQYSQITAQADSLRAASPEKICYYHNNPAELDSVIFKANEEEAGNPGNGKLAGADTLRIPADPDYYAAACELDTARKMLVAKINGRENDSFFTAADNELSQCVSRHVKEAAAVYTAEEQKLSAFEENRRRGTGMTIINAEDFRLARKSFSLRYGRLVARKNRSMDMLHLVSAIRAGSAPLVISSCDYQKERLADYLQYLSDLASGCKSLPEGDGSGVLGRRYVKTFSGNASLMKFFGMTLSVEDKYTVLNPGAESAVSAMRDKGKGMISASSRSVEIARKDFALAAKTVKTGKQDGEKDLSGSWLALEISSMNSSLERCTALLATYKSAEQLMSEYRDVYSRLEEQAASGEEDGNMKKVLHDHSVLSLVSYNSEKISGERKKRDYLKREGSSLLARLVTIRRSCKAKDPALRSYPAEKQLAAFRSILSERKQVKISSWTMDETNIEEIDACAAARLEKMTHRSSWNSSGDAAKDDKTFVSLSGMNISFSMPKGWIKKDDGSNSDSITFVSPDGTASVILAGLRSEKDSLSSEIEKLADQSGKLVTKKWGKREGVDFYHVSFKGKKEILGEIYGMVHGDRILLVRGETRRERYNLFSPLLGRIFDSIEFM